MQVTCCNCCAAALHVCTEPMTLTQWGFICTTPTVPAAVYWQQLPATGYQCIYHARTIHDDYFNYTAPYGGEGSYLTCAAQT